MEMGGRRRDKKSDTGATGESGSGEGLAEKLRLSEETPASLRPHQLAMLRAQDDIYRRRQQERETRGTIRSGLMGQARWSSSIAGGVVGRLVGLNLGTLGSVTIFVGCIFLLSTPAFFLLVAFGVAVSGSVWSIPTAVPMLVVATYAACLVSAANMVRELTGVLAGERGEGEPVYGMFRGYFGALLQIGLIHLVNVYLSIRSPLIFLIPVLYLVPIEIYGFTVPIPIFLGFSGTYMLLVFFIVLFVVGVHGAVVGGLEFLRGLLPKLEQRGLYGAVLALLVVAVFPAFNIWAFSTILEIVKDVVSIG